MAEVEKIVRRYCDEPMAKKKGWIPCDGQCKNCLACIEVLKSGDKRHVTRAQENMGITLSL